MSWTNLLLPKNLTETISRAVHGTYAELEGRAESFANYVRDTRSGLEDHKDTVDMISDHAGLLLEDIQKFRKIKDYGEREKNFSYIQNNISTISERLELLAKEAPVINNSQPYQPSAYKLQFQNFLEEFEKRKNDFTKDIETSKDIGQLAQLR